MSAACKSCGAPIFFATSTSGKPTPIDINQRIDGNITIEKDDKGATIARVVAAGKGRYVTHFATCKNANAHRKRLKP
jgi:hypothetical protein